MSISASAHAKSIANVQPTAKAKAKEPISSNTFATIAAAQNSSAPPTPATIQSSTSASSDGLTIAGKFYTAQQIRDFYAGGGNDYMFAQAQGLRDQNYIHDLALQARAMGGGPTGEEAMKRQFEQYRANNPRGANANNYEGFVADQPQRIAAAIRAGTYTGAATSPVDFEPGGIYAGQNICFIQNGLDANGMSDKWIPWVGWAEGASAPTTTTAASTQSRFSRAT